MKKIELLAPAGDLSKLKIAIDYGADAVYFGGETFSLRAGAGNFTAADMAEGIAYAHQRGKKCYLTLNIFPHNDDIPAIKDYLDRIKDMEIDAFIISDTGVLQLLKEYIPNAEIHVSTQANVTNYMTAKFWYDQGANRIVLAREMSMEDIKTLRKEIPEDMEIEAFVHGAMCISYSGRCLLSNYMIGRDANRGMCAHPCRWKYSLVEEQRPGVYYPIEEDSRGTYIMNSGDLCMLSHMGDLIQAGVMSAKIEGRMKSIFYVATVVAAYRKAIDGYYQGKDFDPAWLEEMCTVSHRKFTTGFYYHRPDQEDQDYHTSDYNRDYTFAGLVLSYDQETKLALVEQRNKVSIGEEIEIMGPGRDVFKQTLEVMTDEEGTPIESAPHPQQKIYIQMDQPVGPQSLIRKRKDS